MLGRPTLLNDEIQETIVRNLTSGCTLKDAALAAGIHEDTLVGWNRRGRAYAEHLAAGGFPNEDEELFLRFFRVTQEARAQARVVSMGRIRKAGHDGDWRADLAFLERSDPTQYGRVTRTEISGRDGGPVRVVNTSDSDILDLIEVQLAAIEDAELETE